VGVPGVPDPLGDVSAAGRAASIPFGRELSTVRMSSRTEVPPEALAA
jgi:hypothetical protein